MRQSTALAAWALVGGSLVATDAGATPGFALGWHQPVGAKSFSVALGDVDGDLDLDAYVADWFDPGTLWLNDGSGRFRTSQQISQSPGVFAILAPLDGNAALDLWQAETDAGDQVLVNDGSGSFTDTAQAIGGMGQQRGAAVGDLDGDGDLDACIPYDDSSAAGQVFFNNGAATFTDSGQALGSYFSRAVALGDVDGDDDLDALFANNAANKLWKNDGAGLFTDSGLSVGSKNSFDVALGDLDGDGDLDAFFANGGSSSNQEEAWLNNGSGVFASNGQSLGAQYSYSVELADLDGDGDLDAVVGNSDAEPNQLYWNDGNAAFTSSGQQLGNGGAISVAVGDLDGDADLDLYFANSKQPDQIYRNNGAGQFTDSGQLLGSSAGLSVALGDLDGDGDPDAVLGNVGGIVRVLANADGGVFVDSRQWLANGGTTNNNAIRLGDLDGDGDLDAFVANSNDTGTSTVSSKIFRNGGNGLLTLDYGIGSAYTWDAALGDVDGDDDLDIVTANAWIGLPGVNRLFLNDGTGNFTQSPQSFGQGDSRSVGLADLDGDADLDLVFGNNFEPSWVFLNDGSGGFTDTGQALASDSAFALALGDLDGDGDRDLVLGSLDGPCKVFVNNGAGSFTDSLQGLGGYQARALHLLDADGDGDLDTWITNGGGGSQPNQVWLNDGSGVFTDSGWAVGQTSSVDSALADLDADGDLDILTVSNDGQHQVWKNLLLGPLFADGFESAGTTGWSSTVL